MLFFRISLTMVLLFMFVSVSLVTIFGESLSATSEGARLRWELTAPLKHEGLNVCFR